MAAYMAELVYKNAGTQDGKVINDNLTGYLGAVAQYAVAAYNAVVGYMHVLHKEVVAAHNGLALGCGTAVDGYILTDTVVVAYLGCRILTFELQILGDASYHGSGMYLVAVAYA